MVTVSASWDSHTLPKLPSGQTCGCSPHCLFADDHESKKEPRITSSCPTVVNSLRSTTQKLLDSCAGSLAHGGHARLLRSRYGPQVKVVFIGPCVAKKAEAEEAQFEGDIAAVLTFTELEKWLKQENINPAELPPEQCDNPGSNWARLFPLAGGLLRTAGLSSDMLAERMATVTGIDECNSHQPPVHRK